MTLPKPKVYTDTISESPNQDLYHINYLKDWLELQQKRNEQFGDHFNEMTTVIQQNNKKQNDSFFHIINRFEQNDQFMEQTLQHFEELKKRYDLLMERIQILEMDRETVKEILQKEYSLNQEILEKVSSQENIIHDLKTKMEDDFLNQEQLKEQFHSFENTQKEIVAKFIILDSYHESVHERLEKQEAFSHKLSRQIETLRSSLFERVSYLSEIVQKEFNKLKNPTQILKIKSDNKE